MVSRAEISQYLQGKDSKGRQIRPPVIPEIATAYKNDPKTQLAKQAMADGSSNAPVAGGKYAYADGIARALTGAMGGYMNRKQDQAYRADEDALLAQRAARGQQGMAAMAPVTPPDPSVAQPSFMPPNPAAMPPQTPGALPQAAPSATAQSAPPAASQIAAALQGGGATQAAPDASSAATGGQPGGDVPFSVASGGMASATASRPPVQPVSPDLGNSSNSFDLRSGLQTLRAQGVNVTSGYRTPAHNVEVGGVPNSYHTKGSPSNPQAYDFTPKAGESMDQLAVRVRAAYPGFDVINEGNHIHVEPSKRMAAGGTAPAAPTDAFAPPKPQALPDMPAPMERPKAPEAVAATRSPLIQAAYKLMIDANPYESASGQAMYEKGLSEQADLNENAAGREQALRNAGYQTDLGMYSADATARRNAEIEARNNAVKENAKQQDDYIKYQREAREKELDRRERIEAANIAAQSRINAAGSRGGQTKPLPPSGVNKLVTDATGLDSIERLNTLFDPRFVGHPVVGGARVAINKVIGGDKPMADWWQSYQQWVSDIRRGLYGASFTKGEKEQFEKITVTPGMDAAVAAGNLARQQQIYSTALGRAGRAYAKMYDADAIQEALGRDPATLGVEPKTTALTGKLSDDDLIKKYAK